MKQSSRMIAGLTAGLILIVGGFMLGLTLKNRSDTKAIQAEPGPISETVARIPVIAVNNNAYTLSPPSQGRAYISVPFPFENIFVSKAIVVMDAQRAKDIAQAQPVILYDIDGSVLDAIGVVAWVEDGKGNNEKNKIIHITLRPLPDGKFPAPAHGEIVTAETSQTYRLPLSALKKDDEGFYIWEAIEDEGKTKAHKRAITGVEKANNSYFIMNRPDYVSNVYILNPDDLLQDGQEITVTSKTLYSPGPIPNAQEIASIPREPPPSDIEPAASSACGVQTACGKGNDAAAFIEKIKTMAAEKPAEPTTLPMSQPITP